MLLNELREGLVQFAEGVADAMQFLLHDRGYILQPFLHLALRDFMLGGASAAVGRRGLVSADAGRALLEGRLLLSLLALEEIDVDMQIPEYLLQKVLPEDHAHVLALGLLLEECGFSISSGVLAVAGSNSLFLRALMQEMH